MQGETVVKVKVALYNPELHKGRPKAGKDYINYVFLCHYPAFTEISTVTCLAGVCQK